MVTLKEKGRKAWVDIAKGLGIITVVLGHSGSGVAYLLYWFHMPLFFVISGFLFKPATDWTTLYAWSYRRARQLLIPYISFLGLLVIVEFYLNNKYIDVHEIVRDFSSNLFPGGRDIGGFYTPFWYITCLLMTQVIFAVILKTFKTTKGQFIIIGLAYFLAHLESGVLKTHPIPVPLDIDVALLTLTYYAIGYFARNALENLKPLFSLASIVFSCLLLLCGWFGLINYDLNIKYLTCDHLIMDIAIPITITVAIFAISQRLADVNWSKYIGLLGAYSLPIMYLHLPFNIVLNQYLKYGAIIFVLIGLILPVITSRFFLERFKITQICLLGTYEQHGHNQFVNKSSIAAH